jgi:hypothetical protein
MRAVKVAWLREAMLIRKGVRKALTTLLKLLATSHALYFARHIDATNTISQKWIMMEEAALMVRVRSRGVRRMLRKRSLTGSAPGLNAQQIDVPHLKRSSTQHKRE